MVWSSSWALTEGVPAHDEAEFYNRLKRTTPACSYWVPTARGLSRPDRPTSVSPPVTSPWLVVRLAS
ncbi:MAG: hypothetical protein CM1200mP26_03320 [Acidimicrobiales bacterium]|nr:MAG: hypothetical protein CM1200mP26_03320 [Acidimicrobiales bacterium]